MDISAQIRTKSKFLLLLSFVAVFAYFHISTPSIVYAAENASECDVIVSKSGNIKTIQDGVDILKPGETLCIRNGVYVERVSVKNKNNATITNYPGENPIIDGERRFPDAQCEQKDKQCVNWCSNGGSGSPPGNCTPCKSAIKIARNPDGSCKPTGPTWGRSTCIYGSLVTISNSDGITVENLEVKNSTGDGFEIANSDEVIVRNINTHHNYTQGFQIAKTTDSLVDSIKSWQNKLSYPLNCFVGGTGVDIKQTRNTTVRNSIVNANYGEGLSFNENAGTRIINNVVYDNFHVNVHLHQLEDAIMQGNFVFCSENAPDPLQRRNIGILMANESMSVDRHGSVRQGNRTLMNNIVVGCEQGIGIRSQGQSGLDNDKIVHNTIVGSRAKPGENSGFSAFRLQGEFAKNSVFKNNLAIQNGGSLCNGNLCSTGGLDSSNNIFINSMNSGKEYINNPSQVSISGWPSGQRGAASGAGMIITDPFKISENNLVPSIKFDAYKLIDSSPAINKVAALNFVEFDFFGGSRPEGNQADIGAHEFGSQGNRDDVVFPPPGGGNSGGRGGDDRGGGSDSSGDGDELLKNPEFQQVNRSSGLPNNWQVSTGLNGRVSTSVSAQNIGGAQVNVFDVTVNRRPTIGHTEVYQEGVPLTPGVRYRVALAAKSSDGSDIDISIVRNSFPYPLYTSVRYRADLSTDWKIFTGVIQLPNLQNADDDGRFRVIVESKEGVTYSLSDLSLKIVDSRGGRGPGDEPKPPVDPGDGTNPGDIDTDPVLGGDLLEYGLLDVTEMGADPTCQKDSTAEIQRAMNEAYNKGLAVLFPEGEYCVSDTLLGRDVFGPQYRSNFYILIGSTAGESRPVIRLTSNSPGFNNVRNPKPVIWMHSIRGRDPKPGRPVGAITNSNGFNKVFRNIDVEIESGNPGAAALAIWGAQRNTIQNVTINMESGFAGVYGSPGDDSVLDNIEVNGGRHGLSEVINSPNAVKWPVFTNFRLYDQTDAAINSFSPTNAAFAGLHIKKQSSPAIKTGAGGTSGSIAIVDGLIELGEGDGGLAIDNARNRNVSLQNVYFYNASTIIRSPGDTLNGGSGWRRVAEYAYGTTDGNAGTVLVNGTSGRLQKGPVTQESPRPDIVSRHGADTSFDPSPDAILGLIRDGQPGIVNAWEHGVVPTKTDLGQLSTSNGLHVSPDITAELQKLIDSGAELIFFPKGKYIISDTIRMGPNTTFIGVAKQLSGFVAHDNWNPSSQQTYLVTTPNSASASPKFAHISFYRPSEPDRDKFGSVLWQSGNFLVVDADFRPLKSQNKTNQRPVIRHVFSGNAGGKIYAFGINSNSSRQQHPGYRHVLIDGTTNPIVIYGANPEDQNHDGKDDNWGIEIKNARNVAFIGSKQENHNTVRVENSNNIFLFGMFNHDDNTIINTNNVIMTNYPKHRTADEQLIEVFGGRTNRVNKSKDLVLFRRGNVDLDALFGNSAR